MNGGQGGGFPAALCPRTAIRVTCRACRASTCTARRRSSPGRRTCQKGRRRSAAAHPGAADWMQVAQDLRRSAGGALAGDCRQGSAALRGLKSRGLNRPDPERALIEGERGRRAEARAQVSSLDTGRCSDMFDRPEKAENTRVFGPSARRWMRPRRCLTGMQRTLWADPNGVWTASDQLPSRVQPALSEARGGIRRVAVGSGAGAEIGWSRPVSRLAEPVDPLHRSRIERAPLRSFPRSEAQSGDGMGFAVRITQLVPCFEKEPQNAEGARR